MAKEIERAGIPVSMMTAMPAIPLSVGSSRVVRGMRVPHVCGDPALSEEKDHELGVTIVRTALGALTTPVSGPTLFEPFAATAAEATS
jgi:glycine reductase complex component B subunit gamma